MSLGVSGLCHLMSLRLHSRVRLRVSADAAAPQLQSIIAFVILHSSEPSLLGSRIPAIQLRHKV